MGKVEKMAGVGTPSHAAALQEWDRGEGGRGLVWQDLQVGRSG